MKIISILFFLVTDSQRNFLRHVLSISVMVFVSVLSELLL